MMELLRVVSVMGLLVCSFCMMVCSFVFVWFVVGSIRDKDNVNFFS